MANRRFRRAARGILDFPLVKETFPRTGPEGPLILVGRLTESDGNLRVRQGTAKRLTSPGGNLLGFELCEPTARPAESRPSSCVLSRSEMECIAGLRGASHTLGLTEEQRVHREWRGRMMPAEDAVELALVKKRAFLASANYVTGDRAVRVYPKG